MDMDTHSTRATYVSKKVAERKPRSTASEKNHIANTSVLDVYLQNCEKINFYHCNNPASWLVVKNLPANEGDVGSVPGLGRSPGEGNGKPFQYSHLENPMDRGAWWVIVHGVAKSQTQQSKHAIVFYCGSPNKMIQHSSIFVFLIVPAFLGRAGRERA